MLMQVKTDDPSWITWCLFFQNFTSGRALRGQMLQVFIPDKTLIFMEKDSILMMRTVWQPENSQVSPSKFHSTSFRSGEIFLKFANSSKPYVFERYKA